MTILVTGANGHIGNNLVRALLAQGNEVRALTYGPSDHLDGLEIERVEGDIRDPATAKKICRGVDTVFHLAALISLWMDNWNELEAINVHGVRHMVQASLETGVQRFVHFSSIHAYQQEPLEAELNETRPLVELHHKVPPYDRSKAAGEREVRQGITQGLNATILTPVGVFGPHDYQTSFFGNALLKMAEGKLPAQVKAGFTWVDVRDVVQGALLAAEKGKPGAKYMLSGSWMSLLEMGRLAAGLTGIAPARFAVPLWLAKLSSPLAEWGAKITNSSPMYTQVSLAALAGNHKISHAKATAELGYRPRPIAETITDTICWFAHHGRLTRPLQLSPEEVEAAVNRAEDYRYESVASPNSQL